MSYAGSQAQPGYGATGPWAPSAGPRDYPDPPAKKDTNIWRTTFSSKSIFIGTGILLLTMLCIVPVWNAIALIADHNYSFWVGMSTPLWLIFLCILIIIIYCITIFTFFAHARPSVQGEQTIMMVAIIFITLLGMTLLLISLPLSKQSLETYNNLMHRCDFSEQTHRMYEYSQVLHNIRAQPECAKKFSVEECAGYEDAPPYTSFMKTMEADFRCAGFCYKQPAPVPPPAADSASGPAAAGPAAAEGPAAAGPAAAEEPAATPTGLQQHRSHHRRHQDHVTKLSLLNTQVRKCASGQPCEKVQSRYPPTLFSDANYQASCEGMAARDMRNFAGDIGIQTFYQGIYLIFIAIATGFLKLISFCVRKDRDMPEFPPQFKHG